MPRVLRTSEVVDDLTEVWCFIAQDNIAAADRVVARIESTFRLLASHPAIGERRNTPRFGEVR